MRAPFIWLVLIVAVPAAAAERKFDFSDFRENQAPPGFRSAVTGLGSPGEWKIVMDEAQTLLQPMTTQAPSVMKRAVLAQVAKDPTDEHFPLLIFDEETYADFTLTTKFKTVSGTVERMAGIAFHIQNETNYYVVRASSLGNTFRFYKVFNGQRGPMVGPEVPIPSGVWHELTVECKGPSIRCLLNGKELVSITDKINPFAFGKFGFWTKSDSVSYFNDVSIVYTPREAAITKLMREMSKHYPRLLGLQVYIAGADPGTTRLVASKDERQNGQPGARAEREVIQQGVIYYGKEKESVSVVMPLRDRNGDPIAAVRVVMKSFPGQTEDNALVRATPIVKEMQARIQTLEDLTD
jgi:hypothetical protein